MPSASKLSKDEVLKYLEPGYKLDALTVPVLRGILLFLKVEGHWKGNKSEVLNRLTIFKENCEKVATYQLNIETTNKSSERYTTSGGSHGKSPTKRPPNPPGRINVNTPYPCDGPWSKGSIKDPLPLTGELQLSIKRLMRLIFKEWYFEQSMGHRGYKVKEIPLQKLSEKTLKQGYEKLNELTAAINDDKDGQTLEALVNEHNLLIPRERRFEAVLTSMVGVRAELDILNDLTNTKLAYDILKSAGGGKKMDFNLLYQGLGMKKMKPLNKESQEFIQLRDCVWNTGGCEFENNHKYEVRDIFRIERNGETDRFKRYDANIPDRNRRLLWYGSRSINFAGLLSQGLRLPPPEAPVSGYRWGKGIYLNDISKPAIDNCIAFMSNNTCLLLLCEVELGKPLLELTANDYDAQKPHYDTEKHARDSNCISTLIVGQIVPAGWRDAACVHSTLEGVSMPDGTSSTKQSEMPPHQSYNKYVVYDVAQIRLRYLVWVDICPANPN
jgi:poly [ADP-ribose] polymerase